MLHSMEFRGARFIRLRLGLASLIILSTCDQGLSKNDDSSSVEAQLSLPLPQIGGDTLEAFFRKAVETPTEWYPSAQTKLSRETDGNAVGILGRGFNPATGQDLPSCFDRDLLKVGPANRNPKVDLRLSYVSNQRQLDHELNATFDESGKLNYFGVKGSQHFDVAFHTEKTIRSNQRALVATVLVRLGGREVTTRPRLPSNAPRHDKGHLQSFVEDCGAQYVSRETGEARISVVFTVSTESEDDLTRLDQNFRGTMDADFGVVSGEGSVDQTLHLFSKEHQEHQNVALDYESVGYFGPVPKKIEDMITLIHAFPSIVSGCTLGDDQQMSCNDSGTARMFIAQSPIQFLPYPDANVSPYVRNYLRIRLTQDKLAGLVDRLNRRSENATLGTSDQQYQYWPKLSRKMLQEALLIEGKGPSLDAAAAQCEKNIESCTDTLGQSEFTEIQAAEKKWPLTFVTAEYKPLCHGTWNGTGGSNDRRCLDQVGDGADNEGVAQIKSGQFVIVKPDGYISVRFRSRGPDDRALLTPIDAAQMGLNNTKIQLHLIGSGSSHVNSFHPLLPGGQGLPTADAGWCFVLPSVADPSTVLRLEIHIPQNGSRDGVQYGDDNRDWIGKDFLAKVWTVPEEALESSPLWTTRCRKIN